MFPGFYNRKNNTPYLREGDKFISGDKVVEVVGDIPRFVNEGSYASLFGDQWKQYKKTQLDSFTGATITTDRINRCLGEFSKKLNLQEVQ